MDAPRLRGKRVHRVLCLQKGKPSRRAADRIHGAKVLLILFIKEIARTNDIDRNAGFLDYPTSFIVIYSAECIDA